MFGKYKGFLIRYKYLPIQVKATFWFLVCSFLQKGISFLTTPVFTRLMNTAEYGNYGVFSSWMNIITAIVSLNMYSAVYTQGLIKFKKEKDVYISSLNGLLLVLIFLWGFLYFLFKETWNGLLSLSTLQMIAMFGLIWTSSVFNLWAVAQRSEFRYRLLVLVTIFVSIAKPVLGIVLVNCAEDKVTTRIVGGLLVELFGYFGLFVIQIKRGKQLCNIKYWKYTLSMNIPLIPHYLSQTILSSADRIMIKNMVDSKSAGIYSLAYGISQIMIVFNAALLQALNPWLFGKIKDKKTKDISSVSYMCLLFIAAINILLIILAPELVAIFGENDYREAIWVIPPIAMSVYFMFVYSLFAGFEFYFEKTSFISITTFLSAALNILLNYFGIKIFGYYAAGYTTLICYILYSVGHYIFMIRILKKRTDITCPYSLQTLLKITIIFVMLGFMIMLTYYSNILRYSLLLIILTICVLKRNTLIHNFKVFFGYKFKKF